jgi:uncharacterized membrane protein
MLKRIRSNIFAGVITVIPIAVTAWILGTLLDLLILVGRPLVLGLAGSLQGTAPGLADALQQRLVQETVAVVMVVLVLYLLGAVTTAVIGRKLISLVDGLMDRVPLVQTIYGSIRRLLGALQATPQGLQRVVLIAFPSPEMKTIGLVTRTFTDSATGETLAAVFVPTTPNPTSGYIEIVPIDRLVPLDWTMDEAMTFVMSGGAVAPDTLAYGASPPKAMDARPARPLAEAPSRL